MKCPKCGRELLSTGMCSNLMCDDRRDREGLISEKEKDIIEEKKVVAKKQKNEIKPDAVLKDYWRNNDRFADLFNQVLFKLHLIITLVIYYGEEKWDGATTLTDLLKIPEEWKGFVNDYKMFLIEMRNENKWEFQNKDNDIFFAIVKEALGKKKLDLKEFKKRYEDRKVDKETLAAISVVLGKQTLLEYAQKSEKGEMSMCMALDNLEKEAREEGMIIG